MLRVLLVEDNRIFREALNQGLCKQFPSMIIEEAATGEEALQKINENSPHLVFIDIRLPGINGFQLTQKIKKDFPNIRIIMLTGYDYPEYRQAALQFGADGFFSKGTFDWDEVSAFINSIDKH